MMKAFYFAIASATELPIEASCKCKYNPCGKKIYSCYVDENASCSDKRKVGLGSEIRWISQKAVSEHPCKDFVGYDDTFNQCTRLRSHSGFNFDQCRTECDVTNGCNAFNWGSEVLPGKKPDCILKECDCTEIMKESFTEGYKGFIVFGCIECDAGLPCKGVGICSNDFECVVDCGLIPFGGDCNNCARNSGNACNSLAGAGVCENLTDNGRTFDACVSRKAELPEVTAPPAAEAASTTEEASTAEEEAINTATGNWDSEKAYTKGEKVEVSGVTYEAQWWTKGENPTQSGEWGVWRVVDGQSSDQNQGGDDQNQGGDDQNQGLVK